MGKGYPFFTGGWRLFWPLKKLSKPKNSTSEKTYGGYRTSKSVILRVKIGKTLNKTQFILTTNFLYSSDKPFKNLPVVLSFRPMGLSCFDFLYLKGQLISKQNCRAITSPKQTHSGFQIYWPWVGKKSNVSAIVRVCHWKEQIDHRCSRHKSLLIPRYERC